MYSNTKSRRLSQRTCHDTSKTPLKPEDSKEFDKHIQAAEKISKEIWRNDWKL
jgi:hypothetical protein